MQPQAQDRNRLAQQERECVCQETRRGARSVLVGCCTSSWVGIVLMTVDLTHLSLEARVGEHVERAPSADNQPI